MDLWQIKRETITKWESVKIVSGSAIEKSFSKGNHKIDSNDDKDAKNNKAKVGSPNFV